jgi:hypothetical protein
MKYYIHKYKEAVYNSYKLFFLYSVDNTVIAIIDYDYYVMFNINRTSELFKTFDDVNDYIIRMLSKFDYKELPKQLEILL